MIAPQVVQLQTPLEYRVEENVLTELDLEAMYKFLRDFKARNGRWPASVSVGARVAAAKNFEKYLEACAQFNITVMVQPGGRHRADE